MFLLAGNGVRCQHHVAELRIFRLASARFVFRHELSPHLMTQYEVFQSRLLCHHDFAFSVVVSNFILGVNRYTIVHLPPPLVDDKVPRKGPVTLVSLYLGKPESLVRLALIDRGSVFYLLIDCC